MPKIVLSLALSIITISLLMWLYRNKPRFFPLFIGSVIALFVLGIYFIINTERHYESLDDTSLLALTELSVEQTSEVGFKIQLVAQNKSSQDIAGFTISLISKDCSPENTTESTVKKKNKQANNCDIVNESRKTVNIYIPSNESRKVTQHFYLNRQEMPESISWDIEASEIKIYQ